MEDPKAQHRQLLFIAATAGDVAAVAKDRISSPRFHDSTTLSPALISRSRSRSRRNRATNSVFFAADLDHRLVGRGCIALALANRLRELAAKTATRAGGQLIATRILRKLGVLSRARRDGVRLGNPNRQNRKSAACPRHGRLRYPARKDSQ